jgi:hypothetical protein
MPSEVAWLSNTLDTSLMFNAQTFSPLQNINHPIGGILYKNYLFAEGILEELTDGVPRKINNSEVVKQMSRLQSLYQFLDQFIINNDALIKSEYAHISKSKTDIINNEDRISQGSYFANSSQLKVVKAPEGHSTTLYFDESYEYPINFLHISIPDSMEIINIEIEFMIYIINESDDSKLVSVVADLANLSYKSDLLTNDKQNRWFTFKKKLTYKKDMLELLGEERYLKIYLWNKDKLGGYIDDIKVRVW